MLEYAKRKGWVVGAKRRYPGQASEARIHHEGLAPIEDRSVPIDPIILPMLENPLAHLAQRLDAWVFAQKNGERRSPTSTWFAKSTQDAAERAGISRSITFHDLRRT